MTVFLSLNTVLNPLLKLCSESYRPYQIGDQTLFYNCVHENNWLVKSGTINSASETLYQEEQTMICNNAFADVISKAFGIANIDYGRVDFGLVNGKVQIYEINTNPSTKPTRISP